MIIDAHHHLWDPAARDYPWLAGDVLAPIRRRYTATDLRAQTSRSGIDGTVLVQTVPTVEETVEFLAMAAADRDLIRGVVGWVDLTDPGVAATLAELRAGPGGELLVGIRHQAQDESDPDWLTRPDVLRGLRAVAEAGLAYDCPPPPVAFGHHRDRHDSRRPLRPRPRREAADRLRCARAMGRAAARTGRAAPCRGQTVRSGHRG